MNGKPHYVWIYICILVCCCPHICRAADTAGAVELEPALPFRDNMVLQRGMDLPIWGKATPGADITVSFTDQRKTTKADQNGDWRLKLDPLKAEKLASPQSVPKGHAMTITAAYESNKSTVTLSNLVVGDVWLCAGQSNIAGKLKGSGTYQGEVANYPGYRHWTPTDEGGWTICTPDREGAGEFKKTAFYFGRDVYRESRVPIGLVVSAVGGSNIESWLNKEPHETGKNYAKLIDPIIGLGIRGMVWYQGESNGNKGESYGPLLKSLIEGYREVWGLGDFPFYYVQLPGYGVRTNELGGKHHGWPALRQEQLETLAIKNTGMAITIDIGDKSVHPPNKVDTGRRLARLALHHDYEKDLVPSGPLFQSAQVKGREIRIRFEYADGGLMLAEKTGLDAPVSTPDKKLECLMVRGEDGVWHVAEGRIDGAELVVSSDQAADPMAVRYASVPHPAGPLLYNKAGLPASPFTTEQKPDRE